MSEISILAIVVASVLVLDWYRRTKTPILSWQSDDNMPGVLRNATLYGSEFPVFWSGIRGVIDQAYVGRARDIILVDTKTRSRDRTKEADIWQLSLYRTLLAQSKGLDVSSTAYVRVVYAQHGEGSRKVHYRRVRLFSHRRVCAKYGVNLAA